MPKITHVHPQDYILKNHVSEIGEIVEKIGALFPDRKSDARQIMQAILSTSRRLECEQVDALSAALEEGGQPELAKRLRDLQNRIRKALRGKLEGWEGFRQRMYNVEYLFRYESDGTHHSVYSRNRIEIERHIGILKALDLGQDAAEILSDIESKKRTIHMKQVWALALRLRTHGHYREMDEWESLFSKITGEVRQEIVKRRSEKRDGRNPSEAKKNTPKGPRILSAEEATWLRGHTWVNIILGFMSTYQGSGFNQFNFRSYFKMCEYSMDERVLRGLFLEVKNAKRNDANIREYAPLYDFLKENAPEE